MDRSTSSAGEHLVKAGIIAPLDEGVTFQVLVGNRDLVTYVTIRMILKVDTKADLKRRDRLQCSYVGQAVYC